MGEEGAMDIELRIFRANGNYYDIMLSREGTSGEVSHSC